MAGEIPPSGPHAGALAVVRVGPADVGRRVSLRRLASGPGEPVRYRDAVGELVRWQGGVLTVRRRNGELVEVPEALLVAGKVVPDPPVRRRRDPGTEPDPATALEEVAARTWPAPDEAW